MNLKLNPPIHSSNLNGQHRQTIWIQTPEKDIFRVEITKISLINTTFRPAVIVHIDPLFSYLDAALEQARPEICTLGNWIYVQNTGRLQFD